MTDDRERVPLGESDLAEIAGELAATLGDEFAGYPVRVDVGDRGRVWIALRDGLGDENAERVTFERIDGRLGELGLDEREITHRISSGASGDDLVLVCEFREPG